MGCQGAKIRQTFGAVCALTALWPPSSTIDLGQIFGRPWEDRFKALGPGLQSHSRSNSPAHEMHQVHPIESSDWGQEA
jgi:hypothetical protein